MNKTFIIVKREYLQRVKTKGFLISTILGPLLMVGYVFFVFFITRLESGELRTIGIVHNQEEVALAVREKLSAEGGREAEKYKIEFYARDGKPKESVLKELNERLENKKMQAYVYLPANFISGGNAEYYSRTTTNFPEIRALRRALSEIRTEARLRSRGLDPAEIRELTRSLEMRTIRVSKEGTKEGGESQVMVGFVFVFITYMVVLLYGIAVMRGVIEEKTSRMVEVILSSVKPFQYMFGKVVGVGAAGLTQVLVWSLSALILSLYGGALYMAVMKGSASANLPTVPVPLLGFFVIYFLLGYFLYATLYAAIGSAVNTEQEAQNMQIPVTLFLVLPMLMIGFIMKAPDSSTATILSLIPLLTPTLMILRMSLLMPPAWQIALSLVLTVAFNLLLIWMAARIYRVGILMYGKRPTIPELLKWVRQS